MVIIIKWWAFGGSLGAKAELCFYPPCPEDLPLCAESTITSRLKLLFLKKTNKKNLQSCWCIVLQFLLCICSAFTYLVCMFFPVGLHELEKYCLIESVNIIHFFLVFLKLLLLLIPRYLSTFFQESATSSWLIILSFNKGRHLECLNKFNNNL